MPAWLPLVLQWAVPTGVVVALWLMGSRLERRAYRAELRGVSSGLRSQTRRLDLTMQVVYDLSRNGSVDARASDMLFRALTEGLASTLPPGARS